eukprot:1148597-Pelagomonas_calceolata.AAC.16
MPPESINATHLRSSFSQLYTLYADSHAESDQTYSPPDSLLQCVTEPQNVLANSPPVWSPSRPRGLAGVGRAQQGASA